MKFETKAHKIVIVLMTGTTGCRKSSLIRELAKKEDMEVVQVLTTIAWNK